MKPKRLFIALPLPDAIKAKVHEWTYHLRQELPFQKWVHRDDVHLTLKFLGEIAEEKIEQIEACLQEVADSFKPFMLNLDELGSFGSPAAPSILWAGVHGDLNSLHQLQQSVEASLVPLGYEREHRPFHPHLTLARRYTGGTKLNREELAGFAKRFAPNELSWQAERIVLYESQLSQRPMYKEISHFRLQG